MALCAEGPTIRRTIWSLNRLEYLINHPITAPAEVLEEATTTLTPGVMDAFAEGYHLKSLHRESLARFFVDAAIVDDFSPHVRQVGGRKTLAEAVDTPDSWDVREHTTVFYNVFPNAILVFHPTWVSLLTLWPQEVNRVRVEHFMLSPADAPAKDLEKSFRHIDEGVFEREDLMIAANIQKSLEGGARSKMLLGLAEEGMRLFHAARDQAIDGSG